MPVKRRLPKGRHPRLDQLEDWEAAFISERMTRALEMTGGFRHYSVRYGPEVWCRPELIARAVALWEARNDFRAQRGLPPVWPENTLAMRALDDRIPARCPRFRPVLHQED